MEKHGEPINQPARDEGADGKPHGADALFPARL
jgi:hypothetical protein